MSCTQAVIDFLPCSSLLNKNDLHSVTNSESSDHVDIFGFSILSIKFNLLAIFSSSYTFVSANFNMQIRKVVSYQLIRKYQALIAYIHGIPSSLVCRSQDKQRFYSLMYS